MKHYTRKRQTVVATVICGLKRLGFAVKVTGHFVRFLTENRPPVRSSGQSS
jgi:hypothetical protein